jgi:hypothetical protein
VYPYVLLLKKISRHTVQAQRRGDRYDYKEL